MREHGYSGILGGIFFVTAVTVPEAGPGVLLTFLLVGAIVSLTALCYAEVASAARRPAGTRLDRLFEEH